MRHNDEQESFTKMNWNAYLKTKTDKQMLGNQQREREKKQHTHKCKNVQI